MNTALQERPEPVQRVAQALAAPITLIDRDLFRFSVIWAAAGHPNAVFPLAPDDLVALTGAPVADVGVQP